jgi:2,5-diketo-D-gluconate reductase A
MALNLNVFDFTLSGNEMARIAATDTAATLFFDHRDPRWSAPSGTGASTTRGPG